MEEVESRFLHLLQPIRDLTKNWEVDVAQQLGEYLEELDHICISFDNGKTTMNFIEAALVIQGSACIYSRKVEYLYSLVYQTLDFISNKKREKQPSSLGPDGRDADATFGPGQEEEFLSLDDIQDTSQANLDMKKDHQHNAISIIPLTPMSLVPPEEAEKRENPLFSRRGELLASRKDFRMNTCTPHASGAFLLELPQLSATCPWQWPRQHGPGSLAGTEGWGVGVGGASWPGNGLGCSAGLLLARSIIEPRSAAGAEDEESEGDDVPVAQGDDVEMAVGAAAEHMEAQRSTAQRRGYVLRERAPTKEPEAHVKELDLWQSLDPFSDSEDKPFRRGRPFLVPQGLDDVVGGKRKRKGPQKLQDFMKWFSATYNGSTGCRTTKRKGPTFADLEVLYWKQLKERVAAQRKLRSQGLPQTGLGGGSSVVGGALRGSPLPAEDFAEHEELQDETPEELADGALAAPDLSALGYEELVRRNVELFIADSQKYARETELSQHVRRWEERMGPLLQEQEERGAFDIHGYGDALAALCGELGRWQPFASLVQGQPPFQVCRYLLASLQLANDYVVELAQDAGLEQALDTLRLRLLTRRRPHERFHTFQPPSACP
ncbi:CNDH2 protein, partial [Urocolius indicus]|nr:CNDH2 protein [Urocolius indicus]